MKQERDTQMNTGTTPRPTNTCTEEIQETGFRHAVLLQQTHCRKHKKVVVSIQSVYFVTHKSGYR